MAYQTDEDGNIFDDGQPSPVQITVTPQSKLPIDNDWIYRDNGNFDQTAFDTAASRIKGATLRANKLPVNDDRFSLLPSENPTYMMQPDLQNTQAGDVPLPPGAALNDAGQPYWTATGEPVPVVPRPGLLPFARTPEGIKLAMPKMLDLASNIVGGGVAAKVPVKAGEMVLDSGAVRTATEANKAVVNDLGLYSQLERSVNSLPNETMTGEQWWKRIWEPASSKSVGIRDANNKPTGEFKNVDTQARSLLPGVKQEELETLSVEKWLKDQKGPVSKQQIKDYVNQNKVELKEKVLGTTKNIDNLVKEEMKNEIETFKADTGRMPTIQEQNGIEQKVRNYINTNPDEYGIGGKDNTQYSGYQLPGGENYQETLLKLPNETSNEFKTLQNKIKNNTATIEDQNRWDEIARKEINRVENNTFNAPHFGDDGTNLLAHIRHNDRTIEGNKSLHIEEVQSDWHQAGRKNGYRLSESQKKELESIDNKLTNGLSEKDIGNPDIDTVLKSAVEQKIVSPEEARNYKEYSRGENSNVPDAPFKKNWDEVALKRMIHKAASEGYDAVSWTPGEAQAARYDLSKHISDVELHGTGNNMRLSATDKNGRKIIDMKHVTEQNLSDHIGKEAAEKLLSQKEPDPKNPYAARRLDNQDLKIGGEGMKAFYDKMLVNRANDIGKKYGSKVEQKIIKAEKYKGYVDYEYGEGHFGPSLYGVMPNGEKRIIDQSFKTKKDAMDELIKIKAGQPIHYFPITPALRNKAVNEGFSMFSSSPVLVPVQGNPFAGSVGK